MEALRKVRSTGCALLSAHNPQEVTRAKFVCLVCCVCCLGGAGGRGFLAVLKSRTWSSEVEPGQRNDSENQALVSG